MGLGWGCLAHKNSNFYHTPTPCQALQSDFINSLNPREMGDYFSLHFVEKRGIVKLPQDIQLMSGRA